MSDQAIQLMHGDCLALMPLIPAGSVDCICTDLPFGTTACVWDTVIPFAPLWGAYRRIIKPNGAIVLFGSQPFTTDIINSNRPMFRYEWIWQKERGSNWQLANRQPMKTHENLVVFYASQPTYNPQKIDMERTRYSKPHAWAKAVPHLAGGGSCKDYHVGGEYVGRFPTSIQPFARDKQVHNAQKPVALLEYLIRTYTNPGDTVLDSCMGSASTAIACMRTGRKFIGIEKDDAYFQVCLDRVKDEQRQGRLFTL